MTTGMGIGKTQSKCPLRKTIKIRDVTFALSLNRDMRKKP